VSEAGATLRVGVIGVGYLGRHHARLLADMPGVRLAGIVDRNEERARQLAAQHGTEALADTAALLDRVDAVTVAVPTESHHAIARQALERGLGVLVEKPMTRTLGEADDLVVLAERQGLVLAVGHTERYNPAVTAAAPLVAHPGFVEIHRLGTFPERSLDIDVVFDLMIHDLDILLATVGDEVVGVEAVGVPVLTGRVDIANARLRFRSGCIANVTASRISRERVRKLRYFQPDAYISIDYAAQEVEHFTVARGASPVPVIQGGKLEIARQEPLRLELLDFVEAVRGHHAPGVTGADGRRALALAERITDAIAGAAAPTDRLVNPMGIP
jgi:predicted dehydrogenase